MNLSTLTQLVISWFKNQGINALTAQGAEASTHTFRPGEQYQAEVVETMANGRSLVKVNGQLLSMNLPPDQARPGQTMRLTYIGPNPRPTFQLSPAATVNALPAVRLSETAQQVSALIRYAQSLPPSTAGGPISTVVNTHPFPALSQTTHSPAASPASPAATLPSSSAQIPAAPATDVSTQLSRSATFVSSALNPGAGGQYAQIAVGTSNTEQRLIVPNINLLLQHAAVTPSHNAFIANQGTLPALSIADEAVEGTRASIATGAYLTTQGVARANSASLAVLPQRLQQLVRESGLFYESHLARWVRGEWSLESILREPQARLAQKEALPTGLPELGRMPEAAARLAGRQLMMLEGAPFLWQGVAWPGQTLQWQIEERAAGGAAGEEEGGWHTEINLTLPRLGPLRAALHLSPVGLKLDIFTGEEAAAELRAALPSLAQRLEHAGLKVLGLQVKAVSDEAAAA